jgi:beta-aspartyl-peptidase (threonine type)
MKWKLVIHGGAGAMQRGYLSEAEDAAGRAGLSKALQAGGDVLAGEGTALDAVESAVKVLEDDPHFNAGRGSVFTQDGRIECDAAIMDGRLRAAGAVAGVIATRHPVSLARSVMTETQHVLLSSAGADAFSLYAGQQQEKQEFFATSQRRQQLEEALLSPNGAFDSDMKFGTVGAVALDHHGNIAAATSTGGLTAKRWGRVGDTAIIGAGTYADDNTAGISCTGSGEHFIRLAMAHEFCARLRLTAATVHQIADALLAELTAFGGKGGFIAVTRTGDIIVRFNTPGMYRASFSNTRDKYVAIYNVELEGAEQTILLPASDDV